MDNFQFSVAMCVYGKDNPEWFYESLKSISINQTLKPNEIVLVVDGPVPESIDTVIEKFHSILNDLSVRFKVIRFEENQGHGNARRASLENVSNKLVAIMDSDDISVPTRFEKLLSVFEKQKDIDIVGGQITEFVGEPNNTIGKRMVPQDDFSIKKYMKQRCPMNLVTVMFKKSSVDSVGGFVDWYCEEDYYLWIRMALANMIFCNVDEALVNVRVGNDMYQRRGGWKYFFSETRLQGFMLKNKVILLPTYFINVFKRFVVQVLLPNKIRGWIFQKFARS